MAQIEGEGRATDRGPGETSELREPMEEEVWQGALRTLEESLLPHGPRARALALRIEAAIASLDPLMARYCDATCPACIDPCCDGRAVFFNRTDLLVQLALGMKPPLGQTRGRPGDPCRYLTAKGCALSRMSRPYVCVWFFCEPQMELFSQERPAFQRGIIRTLESIRTLRIELDVLCGRPPAPSSSLEPLSDSRGNRD